VKSLRLDRDLAVMAALAALAALQFLPERLMGLAPFWGDLGYLHHPWRAFDTQLLQAGRVPLWDQYLYFGMPAAATMQDSVFYAGTVPFFLFGFADALLLYHLAHYALAAWLFYLWLRSAGLRRSASAAGSALVFLGGVWLENRPFINHIPALALFPAFLLLARRPVLLSLALAAAFLAGYPPVFVGAAAAAFLLTLLFSRRRAGLARAWLSAGAAAAALSGCLLVPAVELVRLSRRSAGVGLDEALQFGFSPADLRQWISPWLVSGFDPAGEWWKTCYVGFAGLIAAAYGAWVLPRRKTCVLGAWLLAVLALILGGTNPVSAWLWSHFSPLRFVRYPGNFSYLAGPAAALLAAAGLHSMAARPRVILAFLVLVELSVYGAGAFPTAPAGLFTSPGPLARILQQETEGHRYLLSPTALNAGTGAGYEDWRHRLYGLTNAPVRLRAAGNFGEPLVPRANYEVMDRLYRARGAAAAAALFPWTDVRFLLTPGPVPPTPALRSEGRPLWELNRFTGPHAPAYWFSEAEGERLPAEIPEEGLPRAGLPLEVRRPREDRFSIAGESPEPGWVYVSEPSFAGWSVGLETPRGAGGAQSLPAMTAFQKVHVPAGPWRLDFRYDPSSWLWGLLSTLAAACVLAWRGFKAAAA